MIRRVRTLRPGRLFTTTAGVWVLDVAQPVAAVLDPADGTVRRLVSWTELSPPPPGHSMTARVDDDALWVQNGPGDPLLRVQVDGVRTAVWTAGSSLAAAGRSSAWCVSPPAPQEILHGAGAAPVGWGGAGTLVRADADGRVHRVHTDRPVRGLHTAADALWVQLDVEPWTLRELGEEAFEVAWSSRWVPLSWGGDLPEQVVAASGQETAPVGAVADFAGDGFWHTRACDPDGSPERGAAVHAGGWTWRAGWGRTDDGAGTERRAVAVASPNSGGVGAGDGPTRVVDLGGITGGRVVAATAAGERLAVVVAADRGPSRALVVDAVTRTARPWLSEGEVDISSACWPVHPRPLDADSYVQQVLDDWSRLDSSWPGSGAVEPLARGMSALRVGLVGEWPVTRLECTFDFEPFPGVRLRRSVPLFDELGEIARPEYAQIHLMEDLDTRHLPSPENAVDGVLDV